MKIQTVTQGEAFSEGASLWILADLEHSAWTRKLDWYLNHQLLKAEPHKTRAIAPPLQSFLRAEQLEVPTLSMELTSPLMVAAGAFVPTERAVVLFETDSQTWVERAHLVWSQLNKPHVRLFLPSFVNAQHVQKRFPADANVTIVSET